MLKTDSTRPQPSGFTIFSHSSVAAKYSKASLVVHTVPKSSFLKLLPLDLFPG